MESSTPCQKARRINLLALHWREKSFQWRKLTFSEELSLLFSFGNWTGILEVVHIEKVPALISYLITIDSQCEYIISWHSLS